MTNCYSTFEKVRSQAISSLNIEVTEYRHKTTGAQHIHIQADHTENVFLVALRTVPEDSTGVAHILEHTALCGSKKYPVRDPFFMMIRRSLNTFMNAFTSSDWTAYPFASQNRKDFDNLLDVYLDAVFFSRLDPLDFAQEGHRLDFAEPGNPESPLVYKGVVFNEMKGAMSSITSQLWQGMSRYLYPSSTYHHNSGGDPQAIPDLSYEQLKHFYKTHYHPSNAIFMTFGDISAAEHQENFEQKALKHFQQLDEIIQVHPEKRYFAPIRVEEAYAYQAEPEADIEQKAHIVMGWLLGPSINLKENLEANLLSSLLFDNSASPLLHLLETTELGASPSPMCGLDDSQLEMLFMCGLADTSTDAVAELEEAVMATLQTIVDEGIDKDQLEASMHQLELRQREIGGDHYPYGLQLILNSLSAATHRGDILAALDLEASIADLREDIKQDGYIPQLIKRLLIDNPHRVTYTLRPDEQLQARQTEAEAEQLAEIKARLSDAEKAAIIEQAKNLEARQNQEDDKSILPQVTLDDIPKEVVHAQGKSETVGQFHIHSYAAGTNGLCYHQRVSLLPALSQEQLATLPWYSLCLTEVGIGNQDYLQVQQRQSQIVGSISSYYNLHGAVDNANEMMGKFTLSSKALKRQQQGMCELMEETLRAPRFDEAPRILELVTQARLGREQSITGSGHVLAMQAASAPLSATAQLVHQLMGLEGIHQIKALEKQLKEGGHADFQSQLESLHQLLQSSQHQWLLVSEEEQLAAFEQTVKQCWQGALQETPSSSRFSYPLNPTNPQGEAWIANSQVHFCAKAYPTVSMDHDDASALGVLAGVLRNNFLHRSIREQGGAYGGGAGQDNNSGCFRFYSYRDPRMTETLSDFDEAINWLFDNTPTAEMIEESVLGIIGSLDKPGSPAGEAKQEFHAQLTGRTQEKRNRYRQQVTQIQAEDLRRVAETYLQPEKGNIAVVTGHHGKEESEQLGLKIIEV